MNYQESLTRLRDRQKWLKENKSEEIPVYDKPRWFPDRKIVRYETEWNSEKDKEEWELVKSVAESYSQSSAEEIKLDKIEQVFSELVGFKQQKEELKSVLLLEKYQKAKGIEFRRRGKILCFIGPPGVGKTLFAEKFAETLGKKYYTIEVGGMNNPQMIRGIDKSFVNSHVGKVIQAIQETKTCDPVILIDEVEKAGKKSNEGSLQDALLHILDPEQNQRFEDAFLNLKIDISRITFVLTANDIEKIPAPLKSRLEILQLKGYNETEKVEIGKIMINKIFREDYNNVNRELFEMGESALRTLIGKSEEEGARQLKQEIQKIILWCFSQWAQAQEKGESETKIVIDEKKVNELVPEKDKNEESEEDKLRKKIEELEQENEDLKKKPISNLQLFKPLEVGKKKENCLQHQKITCQTSEGSCALCKLEELAKQMEVMINKETLATWEKVWQQQKSQWEEQSEKLQKGSEEEKELAQQIKSSIKKIDKKFSKVRQENTNSQQNKNSTQLLWIIGGGIMLTLIGFLGGWLLVKKFQKKKKKNKSRLSSTNSGPPS